MSEKPNEQPQEQKQESGAWWSQIGLSPEQTKALDAKYSGLPIGENLPFKGALITIANPRDI